jgi:hypothetical protein
MPPKQKSTFDKAGQKYPTPLQTEPLARFYTSLYKQSKQSSPMAIKWCLEHGVFTKAKALIFDAQLKLGKLKIATALVPAKAKAPKKKPIC